MAGRLRSVTTEVVNSVASQSLLFVLQWTLSFDLLLIRNQGTIMNLQPNNGTFIHDVPCHSEPTALDIQATVTLPELSAPGYKDQDIIAIRSNHFGFARVVQCGVRLLGTQHGYQHFLILGIRGKAADEESDPYLEKVLCEVMTGMHLNIVLHIKVDTANFGQEAEIGITIRNPSSGDLLVLHQGSYDDYPSLFHGLTTRYFPRVVTCYRSELLNDHLWRPYEKTDYNFTGEVHYMTARYCYQSTFEGLSAQGPVITIVEGTLRQRNGRVQVIARRPGDPGTEFSREFSEGSPASHMVSTLVKMATSSTGSPGPYLVGLSTHPSNETKWYAMEQIREVTVLDIVDNTKQAIPVKDGQVMTILFAITGQ